MSNKKDKNKFHHYRKISLDSSSNVPSCKMSNVEGGAEFLRGLRSLTLFLSEGEKETKFKKMPLKQLVEIICSDEFEDIIPCDKQKMLQEIVNRFSRKLSIPAVRVELCFNPLRIEGALQAEMFTEHDGEASNNNVGIIVNRTENYGIRINLTEADGTRREVLVKSQTGPATLFALLHEIKHVQQSYIMHNLFNGGEAEKIEAVMALQGSLSYARKIDTNNNKSYMANYILNPLEIDANLYAYKIMKMFDAKTHICLDINTQFNFISSALHILEAYGYKVNGVEPYVGRKILSKNFKENIKYLESLEDEKLTDREGFKDVEIASILDLAKNKADVKAYFISLENQLEDVYNDVMQAQRMLVDMAQFKSETTKNALLETTEIDTNFLLSFVTTYCEHEVVDDFKTDDEFFEE